MTANRLTDLRRIYAVQGIRAFAYGFGSVVLGVGLAREGLSGTEVGAVLASLLAGSAVVSLGLVTRADRIGRRRIYVALLVAMGISGMVFALTDAVPLLVVAALTGTLSVDVVESGPFTSLEQAMVPQVAGRDAATAFGRYNAVASLLGSVGALAAGGPAVLARTQPTAPPSIRWLLLYPVAAAAAILMAARLSPAVEAPAGRGPGLSATSRSPVIRLAALFAVDSFAGGFVVQTFIAFWLTRVLGASALLVAVTLGAAGFLQTASFMVAPWVAARIGLLRTMVFTHLPSNVFLALLPVAPSVPVAVAFLLARFSLSQMDVPARQAFLAALVPADERAAAASVTNAARTAARPVAAPIAGAVVGVGASGLPFFLAGGIKALYDVVLFLSFRGVPLDVDRRIDSGAPHG